MAADSDVGGRRRRWPRRACALVSANVVERGDRRRRGRRADRRPPYGWPRLIATAVSQSPASSELADLLVAGDVVVPRRLAGRRRRSSRWSHAVSSACTTTSDDACHCASLAAPLPRLISVSASCDAASYAAARAWATRSAVVSDAADGVVGVVDRPPLRGRWRGSARRATTTPPTASGTLTIRRKRSGQPQPRRARSRPTSDPPGERQPRAGTVRGGELVVHRGCADPARRRAGRSTSSVATRVRLALVGGADREALAVVRPGLLDQPDVAAPGRRWPPPAPAACVAARGPAASATPTSSVRGVVDRTRRTAGAAPASSAPPVRYSRLAIESAWTTATRMSCTVEQLGGGRGGRRRSTSGACRRRTHRRRRRRARRRSVTSSAIAQAERRRAAPGDETTGPVPGELTEPRRGRTAWRRHWTDRWLRRSSSSAVGPRHLLRAECTRHCRRYRPPRGQLDSCLPAPVRQAHPRRSSCAIVRGEGALRVGRRRPRARRRDGQPVVLRRRPRSGRDRRRGRRAAAHARRVLVLRPVHQRAGRRAGRGAGRRSARCPTPGSSSAARAPRPSTRR